MVKALLEDGDLSISQDKSAVVQNISTDKQVYVYFFDCASNWNDRC